MSLISGAEIGYFKALRCGYRLRFRPKERLEISKVGIHESQGATLSAEAKRHGVPTNWTTL